MGILKVDSNKAKVRKPDENTTIKDYGFSTPEYNMVKGELNGFHGTFKNKVSTKTYFIIEGEIEFDIEGESFVCKKDDLLSIPPNKWHSMNGKMAKFIIATNPPFDPKNEEIR